MKKNFQIDYGKDLLAKFCQPQAVENMVKDKKFQAIKKRVNKLTRKIKDIESRLEKLETSQKSKTKTQTVKKSSERSKSKKEGSEGSEGTDHNYLKKTIDNARQRYEKEHGR